MSFKEGFPGEAEFLSHMGEGEPHDGEWLKRPESDIALGDLPEYWSGNGTTITQGLRERVTERCIREYYDMFERHSPDSFAGQAAQDFYDECRGTGMEAEAALRLYDRDEWVRLQEGFFQDVKKLWRFDFRDSGNGCRLGPNVEGKGVITPAFQTAVPEFNEWLTRELLAEHGGIPNEKKEVQDMAQGQKPVGLGGMDLSKAVTVPPAPEPAPEKERPAERKGVVRDGSDMPGYDDDYAIPDEEAEKARGWPDDRY